METPNWWTPTPSERGTEARERAYASCLCATSAGHRHVSAVNRPTSCHRKAHHQHRQQEPPQLHRRGRSGRRGNAGMPDEFLLREANAHLPCRAERGSDAVRDFPFLQPCLDRAELHLEPGRGNFDLDLMRPAIGLTDYRHMPRILARTSTFGAPLGVRPVSVPEAIGQAIRSKCPSKPFGMNLVRLA